VPSASLKRLYTVLMAERLNPTMRWLPSSRKSCEFCAMAQAPATVDVPAELPCTRVSVRPRWTMPSAKLRL